MNDATTSLLMTEKLMPLVQNQTAHCALAYTKVLVLFI
jgi:hypothetical protein